MSSNKTFPESELFLQPTPKKAEKAPRVTFTVRQGEPQVGWALAGYTVWACVFLNPPGFEAWLIACLAAVMAEWSRRFPARTPGALQLRGMLLGCGGFALLAMPGLGGPAGIWVFWPLAISIGYGLLLPLRASRTLHGMAFLSYAAACALSDVQTWQIEFAAAGAVAAIPWIAATIGSGLQKAEQRVEQTQVDRRSQLYNEEGFFSLGGQLFDNCRETRQPFSLALLSGNDLRDASALLGKRAANDLFGQMVKAIVLATPPGGLAARTDSVEFAIAMPGVAAEKAESLIYAQLGRPPKVEIRMSGAKATIVLELLVAEAPPEIHSLEELYDRLHVLMTERGEPPPTVPATDRSSLHGLLMADPPMPHADRPTMPMPLSARTPAAPGPRRKGG